MLSWESWILYLIYHRILGHQAKCVICSEKGKVRPFFIIFENDNVLTTIARMTCLQYAKCICCSVCLLAF